MKQKWFKNDAGDYTSPDYPGYSIRYQPAFFVDDYVVYLNGERVTAYGSLAGAKKAARIRFGEKGGAE